MGNDEVDLPELSFVAQLLCQPPNQGKIVAIGKLKHLIRLVQDERSMDCFSSSCLRNKG